MAAGVDFDPEGFERRLGAAVLEGIDAGLEEPAARAVRSGGKRVRARLVHLFGTLAGGDGERIADLAVATELLHAATLIHDDLVDQAASRRGVETLHVSHGADVAILVGDLYVARCGTTLGRVGDPVATSELFGALSMMVHGELDQRRRRFDLAQTEADYATTVARKTASLLEAGCAAAVALAGGDGAAVAAARAYAGHLGFAVQVVDDVLDYTGDPEAMGKPVGGDIREGTVTLPLIYALQMSPAPMIAIIESARARDDFGAVIQGVRRSGAIERCLGIAAARSEAAVTALDAFPDRPERAALADLARGLAAREA